MNKTSTLALLLLFFAGLAALWYADHANVPTSAERRQRSGLVLPALAEVEPGSIRRVEIVGGESPMTFERQADGDWRMTRPVGSLADRSQLDALVVNLKLLPKSLEAGTIDDTRGDYGLTPPARVVRLYREGDSRPVAALELGRLIGDRRYVRAEGQPGIEVVDARRLAAADLPPVNWRERSLFAVAPFEVNALVVRRGDRTVLDARRRDGAWTLAAPIQAPGDDKALEGLLADLAAARVADGDEGFLDDDVPAGRAVGLEPPDLTIRLNTEGRPGLPGRTRTVEVGASPEGRPDRRWARRGESAGLLRIDARSLNAIPDDAHALRSKHVARLDPRRVDLLRLRAGGTTHLLARDADGWRVVEPVAGRGDRKEIDALVGKLNDMQALEWRPADRVDNAGLDEPALTLEAWQGGLEGASADESAAPSPQGPPAVTLRIGRADPVRKVVYGQAEGDPYVLFLPENARDLIPRGPLAFRDRTVLAVDRSKLRRLRIVRGDRVVTLAGGGADNETEITRWRMTEPIAAPASPEFVARIAVLLSGLRAEGLVQSKSGDLAPFGLDQPALRVSWGLSATGATFDGTLLIGRELPSFRQGRFARIQGEDSVFSLSPAAVAILEGEPRDPAVFHVRPDRAALVVLKWPGAEVALERRTQLVDDAPAWEPLPGYTTAGLDPRRIDDLLRQVANLRALDFVQYEGPFRPEWGLASPRFAVEIKQPGEVGALRLRLGADDPDGRLYATAADGDSGPVFRLPAEAWAGWLRPMSHQPAPELPAEVFAP